MQRWKQFHLVEFAILSKARDFKKELNKVLITHCASLHYAAFALSETMSSLVGSSLGKKENSYNFFFSSWNFMEHWFYLLAILIATKPVPKQVPFV